MKNEPVFPQGIPIYTNQLNEDGEQTIKVHLGDVRGGLTKLEYFAGLAMQALLSNDDVQIGLERAAVNVAMKLITELEERESQETI
jgi:hypothetical protein